MRPGAETRESDQRGRSGVFALMGVLVLVVGLIVAGRAIVVGLTLGTVLTTVVPSPAIAVLFAVGPTGPCALDTNRPDRLSASSALLLMSKSERTPSLEFLFSS